MFHAIPPEVAARMRVLEERDRQDRADGTPRMQRLRQITPDTARFLALLAASAPEGAYVEVGSSAGYSSLWIGLACRALGRRLTTFEVLPEKVRLAQETLRLAGMEDTITLVHGDARDHLARFDAIAYCFLDAEKGVYQAVYDLVVPRLVAGGFLLADNVISHQDELAPFVEQAAGDPRVDALVVLIGKGVLLCRKA